MDHIDYKNLSTGDLRTLLLTCDGKGKEAKEKALNELLDRTRENGYTDGHKVGYDEGFEDGFPEAGL